MDNAKLKEVAAEELVQLWRDLERVIRNEVGDDWPPAANVVLDRIKALTAAMGPAPWERVPLILLETGLYREVSLGLGLDGGPANWQIAEARTRQGQARRS